MSRPFMHCLPLFCLLACSASAVEAMPGMSTPQTRVRLEIDAQCGKTQDFTAAGFASCLMTAHVKDASPRGQSLNLSPHQGRGRNLEIVWEVRESRNHGSVAPGWERMTSGLSWSEPVSGRTTPVEAFWTHANEDGDASARLFDVLGERTVTVCASVMSDGVRGSACTDLEFGRGPLSRFSKPGETPVSYREHLAFCQG